LGRKVHPIGFRLGFIQDWQAKWYAADPHYAEAVQEDMKLRQAIQSKYVDAAVSRVDIERQVKEVAVTIYTARPGIVIGRGGQRVEELRQYLEQLTGKKIRLNIREIRQPELDAYLVARTIGDQIERRIAYRRAMKQALFRTMQAGAGGIRVTCSGRLGDAEIARRQVMHQGQVPLQTIRADIDYGFAEAHTTLGRTGIKVWIYKGEVLPEAKAPEAEAAPAEAVAVKPEVKAPAAVAVAPVEKPAEPVAAEAPAPAPAVAEVKVEEVARPPAARKARKTAAEAEVKPAEAEAKPVAKEKPAKPTRRRVRELAVKTAEEPAEAEIKPAVEEKPAKSAPKRKAKEAVAAKLKEKPAEPVAKKKAKAAAAKATEKPAKAKAKPAKPAKRTRKATTQPILKKKEAKDVTT